MENTFASLFIFVSVFVFVTRIYEHFKKQHYLSRDFMTKIGTFHVLLLFVFYIKFFNQSFYFWIFGFCSLLILPILFFTILKFYQNHFYSEFVRFLSLTILFMQRGQSFQSSMKQSLQLGQWRQEHLLVRIYQNVAFSQQERSLVTGLFAQFIGEVESELMQVKEHQHQAIDRLCNLRKNLRERLTFRQRSRQIWGFFIYQVGLLSLIYFGLMTFILFEYGFNNFSESFFLSFSLYLTGVLITFLLLRNKKWSI